MLKAPAVAFICVCLIGNPFGDLEVEVLQNAKAPALAGCDLFPAHNIWNVPVDTLPWIDLVLND